MEKVNVPAMIVLAIGVMALFGLATRFAGVIFGLLFGSIWRILALVAIAGCIYWVFTRFTQRPSA